MNPIYYRKQFHPNKLYLIHENNDVIRVLTICKFIHEIYGKEICIIPTYEKMRMKNYRDHKKLTVMNIKDSRQDWRQNVKFRPEDCDYFELTDEEAHSILIEEI
jgi:hypothetical protein